MKIINAHADILFLDDQRAIDEVFARIETAGRTCYKSEANMTPESARAFARIAVQMGHESVLEHGFVMVRFTVDRGVSHEIVRHRIASYSQESTRYCNYSKDKFGNEPTFIMPCFFMEDKDGVNKEGKDIWKTAMDASEAAYLAMLNKNCTPQEARSVLPNSLKTEVVMTANVRSWRNFFRLRAACEKGMPHPQMLEVAVPLFQKMKEIFPELFDDIVIPDEIIKKYGKNEGK